MNRMLLAFAAAVAATTVIATPLFAQTSNNPATEKTEPPGGQPAATGTQPMPGRWGMGMHGGAPGFAPWRMRKGRMAASPKAWCEERLARRAGMRAYIGAKLNLTPQQQPLWQKLQALAQNEAQKERQLCDSMKPGATPTVIERLQRMEKFLTVRLDGLKAAMPAVEALYRELTPAQREIINHPFRMP